MLTVLVGFLAAAAGAAIGKALDQRVEERRWLRESRGRALNDYVTAYQKVRAGIRVLATSPRDSAEWSSQRERRRELMAEYNAALATVEMFCAPDVVDRTLDVDVKLRDLNALVLGEALGPERWHEERRALDEEMVRCVNAIRGSLRLKPLSDGRLGWSRRQPTGSAPDSSD